jgi:hypothetical protein
MTIFAGYMAVVAFSCIFVSYIRILRFYMRFTFFRHIYLIPLCLAAFVTIHGCFFVREKPQAESAVLTLSPIPEISMSDELARTPEGDMIALLPDNWRLIDVEGKASSDVFAVAVNPDYTLAAIFSRLRTVDRNDSLLARDGALTLARLGMARRERKTAGMARQTGKVSSITVGTRNFGSYQFTPDGVLQTQVAVFTSSLGQHYEFALTPVVATGKPLPDTDDIQRTFRSILATIQF